MVKGNKKSSLSPRTTTPPSIAKFLLIEGSLFTHILSDGVRKSPARKAGILLFQKSYCTLCTSKELSQIPQRESRISNLGAQKFSSSRLMRDRPPPDHDDDGMKAPIAAAAALPIIWPAPCLPRDKYNIFVVVVVVVETS